MKVFEIRDGFGFDNLVAADRPRPEPGHGEVLLEMRAASLNFRDILMVKGLYNPHQPLPLIPCSDGVGKVVAVGEGVSRVQAGDRVATIFCQKWRSGAPDKIKLRSTLGGPLDGTLAQFMVLSEHGVVKVPEHLSDVEAATLPCAALTAWSALVTQGDVGAGDTVLVQGTGGVSLFALQFARALGARVIVTSSSDAKLERMRALGADETINYRTTPEWDARVIEVTDGIGADRVIEVGGPGTLERSINAVRVGGVIALIGILTGVGGAVTPTGLMRKSITLRGIYVGSRQMFTEMNRAIAAHHIKPVIDERFAFDDARGAYHRMRSGQHFGKLVVDVA